MPSRSADKDPLLAARPAARPLRTCARHLSRDVGCKANHGPAQLPVTRNGVLLLPARQGGGPVDLELVNLLRDSTP